MKNLTMSFLFSILAHIIYCQQPVKMEKKYWIDAGVGNYFTLKKSGGLNWNASINFINKETVLYKFRYLELEEFNLFGPSPSEKFKSGGIMIGKVYNAKYGHCAFSGGIGIIRGAKRGKFLYKNNSFIGDGSHYEEISFNALSIPLEVEVQYKPIKYLGIGTSFFCDLNIERPMFGFLFKISLGKLR